MKGGFFTRQEAGVRQKSKPSRAGPTTETLHKAGSSAVVGMNPAAVSPNLQPSGTKKPLVYILGTYPGAQADKTGKHFVGASGDFLRSAIPSDNRRNVRFDYCVRTRPPNREPLPSEVECFRIEVEQAIRKAAPKVVLGVGTLPFEWATNQSKTALKAFSGKRFPVSFGGHVCWFIPVFDPTWLLRIQEDREDKVPGKEWIRIWQSDIEEAFQLAESDVAPTVISNDKVLSGTLEHCLTVDSVDKACKRLMSANHLGWDYETNCLRPYKAGSKVLSVAVSDGFSTYCIPLQHSQAPWSEEEFPRVLGSIRSLFCSGKTLVAHNVPFEMEWTAYLFGIDTVHRMKIGCSLQAAYVLDPGPPGEKGSAGHSLDAQCRLRFGFDLKAMSPAAAQVKHLENVRLDKVLDYNALDAKWCLRLWKILIDEIEEQGLRESYDRQINRVIPIILSQFSGITVDKETTNTFYKELSEGLITVKRTISEDPDVEKWEIEHGSLNPASPTMVGKFLNSYEELHGLLPKTRGGGFSTESKFLETIKDIVPVVENILELRAINKLKGTYVDRFMPSHKDTYVYPDGKVHCSFSIARTRTTRLSSEEPNNQNWPKRRYKEVRSQLVAPPGHVLVSSDQGQIEARVLAMESKDPKWVKMIWDDYDVHEEYARKLCQIVPLEERYGDMKAVRSMVKNQWVFPAFYGSSPYAIIRNMDLPEGPALDLFEEFWECFKGIKQWQQDKWNSYIKEGCVWSLTGRRRLAPLSRNMVVNSPVQTTASDITEDANDRLSFIAREQDKPWLQSVLLVHDDITFIMPEDKLEEGIEEVVKQQLGFSASWLNVPLSVEVEIGPNLLDMTSIGKWSSKDL